MLSFGERLKKARERKGISQKQVMELINLSNKSLSRYETNYSAPDPETIKELIELYDVSAEYILGLSIEMGHAPDYIKRKEKDKTKIVKMDIHEKLESLSKEAQKKAEDYIEMLKIIDEIKK